MHNVIPVTEDLLYLGGNDRRVPLFESAFPVPRGVSYNSYLLKGDKTVLFDTVDLAVSELFFENLAYALGGRGLDYLVIHHMEPDHSANVARILELYPGVTLVANAKTAQMLKNFFPCDHAELFLAKEGDELKLGGRTLKFLFAPMVHWPEVMFTYVPEEKLLFSADAFGTFGALGGSVFADECDFDREFLPDARRYYFNIVGKYGVQVQNALKKAAELEIGLVCPLHGPVWRKDLGYLFGKYDTWSKYLPEERGVAVFYASVYGHTKNAAEILASSVVRNGAPRTRVYDVSAIHVSELLSEAFRFSHVVFASTTYNNGIFVSMENFLSDLAAHGYKNRAYALVENGSWAPQAGTLMEERISQWKDMRRIGGRTTVLSAVKEKEREELEELGRLIAEDVNRA